MPFHFTPVPEHQHWAWTKQRPTGSNNHSSLPTSVSTTGTGSLHTSPSLFPEHGVKDHERAIYTRSHGLLECRFYWNAVLNGTVDIMQIAHLEVLSPYSVEQLFSRKRIEKAWMKIKWRNPLLGAVVDGPVKLEVGATIEEVAAVAAHVNATPQEDLPVPIFVVDTNNLSRVHSNELHFQQCSSRAEAIKFAEGLLTTSERPFSPHRQTAQLYFLFRNDYNDETRRSNEVHVVFLVGHNVIDGLGLNTLLREFLEALTSISLDKDEPDLMDDRSLITLEERLALVVPVEALWLNQPSCSLAKRRCRKAIAAVIVELRQAMMRGGQTLPRTFTTNLSISTAGSTYLDVRFTAAETASILATCRAHSVTFGSTFYVIGQVAMARVLFRHYLQGKITHNEWEYRKREPWYSAGPANIRSLLDEEWRQAGGATTICPVIAYLNVCLPYLPLGQTEGKSLTVGAGTNEQVPDFGRLLSRGRFWLRTEMVQKQVSKQMNHPLYGEMALASEIKKIKNRKAQAIRWLGLKAQGLVGPDGEDKLPDLGQPVPLEEQGADSGLLSHFGSTLGDFWNMIPRIYPTSLKSVTRSQQQIPQAQIRIDSTDLRQRCQARDLQLSAFSLKEGLVVNVYCDSKMYAKELVKEWLDEVKKATLFYLGAEKDISQAKSVL